MVEVYAKQESSMNHVEKSTSFLLGLLLDLEDGRDMFFRNVSCLSTDYKTLYTDR